MGADPDAARLLAASEPDEADAARLLELARAAEAGEIPRVAKAGKAVLLYGGADPEELESKITFSGYDIYLYAGSVVKDGDVEAARAMLATLDELVSGRSVSLRSDQEAGISVRAIRSRAPASTRAGLPRSVS